MDADWCGWYGYGYGFWVAGDDEECEVCGVRMWGESCEWEADVWVADESTESRRAEGSFRW